MSKPPAITQKVATRAVLCLFALAALFAGYNYLRGWKDPDDYSVYNSKGMILALKLSGNGSETVILKPDGQLLPSPDYKDGKTDRDPTWRPDGAGVLFCSDRDTDVFNIYRWNLMRGMVQRRSLGSRGQLAPDYGLQTPWADRNTCLIIAGGFVQEFKPVDGTTLQVLPPRPHGASEAESDEGSGVASQFDALYHDFGSSFRIAKWGKNRHYVVAVMRGEEGEVLLVQNMVESAPPALVTTGDHIDFAINPATGMVFYTVQGYKIFKAGTIPKDKIAEANADLKKRHRIGVFDPEQMVTDKARQPVTLIQASESDKACFGEPSISPDGSEMVLVLGRYVEGTGIDPGALIRVQLDGSGSTAQVAAGAISEPSWSPDGKQIVYIKQVGKERAICTNSPDGGHETCLTQGKGDFSHPSFSPQSSN